MKKLIFPLFIGLLAFALTACSSNAEGDKPKENKNENTAQADQQDQQKQQQDQQKQMEEMQKKMEQQKIEDSKTVAIVNDKELLGSDYNAVLASSQSQLQQMGQDPTSEEAAKQIKEQTINSLVGQTLLIQDADKKGYKASDDEVNKQLEESKKQYKSEKEFNDAVKQAGLDADKLKAQFAESITFQKYVDKEIKVDEATDKEIQQYYDQISQQGNSTGQKPPKLEEIKPKIKEQLEQQKKQEKLVTKVEELKKQSKVDIKI
ncbi:MULTISPECIES: SurA N-terminal domain-containing protein [Bacillus]|uniref:peptidylprolyl isomerase n=2 Tax=Bacillus TaxID=1386 RepID=A0A0M4FTW9_9BACI|nr:MULTISPECIES: SurA N-terminal domain-containing protein [Bacillus]ALC83560.1 peptidylprolyl isomerase [Bacillus gobiensis]MBP1082548.1 parvulin-like peptidyl-prolyl isomerase [Bacillus capparidis]MED1097221.1 SurA N-terminal domain-containing protein [Bacillus capparidis]